ncbi:hypothetical protein [Chryseobacterium indologenes]|uniref:DUF4280 domain-containing protein n=1 Tax=Chryseobacterium indologenes TaxID=253 RepID=A0A0N1KRR0_CHRID|nr:hypothetical protein [Chryseobacterium indologenes]KPE49409.1 hypothetical protein AOB46_19735 [Chryseobacterium indologenes]
MAVYLPEKVFAVCTNQLNSDPKKFELSDKRPKKTVKLGSQQRTFLIKLDKKLSEDFNCKSGWSSGLGTVAFGGGVVGGMLLVAATSATVPVAGWVVGGLIAIAAIGYGIWQMMQTPTCSEMIGFQESQWKKHHTTVYFDSNGNKVDLFLALTKNSLLACKEGGVLLPFITETAANNAAESIASNNNTEKWVNIGSGALAGVLFGFSLGTTLPIGGFLGGARTLFVLKQTAIFGAWIPVGYFIINPLASATGGLLNSNENYDTVKDASISTTPLPQPADSWDPVSPVKDGIEVTKLLGKNNASQADINKFEAGIAEAERQGTYSLKNNPELREMINRMKAGEFGPELQDRVTNKSGNSRGMINEKNMNSVKETHNQNSNAAIRENIKSASIKSATATGGILTLIAPFIGNYFAERAIRVAADMFANEDTSSIKVNAKDA